MNTVHVLIMIFGGGALYAPPIVVKQEFSSYNNCMYAMRNVATAHREWDNLALRSKGCYPK